jgi:hypothetical protein
MVKLSENQSVIRFHMLYRLNTPTMGIVNSNGGGVAVIIPAGAVLTINNPLPETSSSPPVEVDCSGKTVRMFPIDIRERGEPIDSETP